jgi:hypothetical protein
MSSLLENVMKRAAALLFVRFWEGGITLEGGRCPIIRSLHRRGQVELAPHPGYQ